MGIEVIKKPGYMIFVDDEAPIKNEDYCLAFGPTYDNEVVQYRESPCPPPYVSNLSILRKIIGHIPLKDSSPLNGVRILSAWDLLAFDATGTVSLPV
jgi:hypothetical protein